MQAKVGTVILEDCLSRECVKRGRKGVWEESFSTPHAVLFKEDGLKLEKKYEVIQQRMVVLRSPLSAQTRLELQMLM